jgi:hypothetical protein
MQSTINISLGLTETLELKNSEPYNMLMAIVIVYKAEIAINIFVLTISSLRFVYAYTAKKTQDSSMAIAGATKDLISETPSIAGKHPIEIICGRTTNTVINIGLNTFFT